VTPADETDKTAVLFRKILSPTDPALPDFYSLYSAIFTLPEEREPIEGFQQVLRLNADAAVQAEFGPLSEEILLAIDRATGTIVGAANYITYRYPESSFGTAVSCQLNFLCVADAWRNRGIAGRILEQLEIDLRQQADGANPRHGVFITCEQNNPEKMTASQLADDLAASGIDAHDRLRWWRRQDYRRLLFPYIQPPLNPGQAACEYLDYYIHFANGAHPDAIASAVLREHLRRFLAVSVGKLMIDLDRNPQWIVMEKFLSAHPEIGIS
jgi:GNAT superfamily N-acetyltransferase